MGFIASLLPGLRDLRAPMAAGYLWLTIAALGLRTHLPRNPIDQPEIVRDITYFLNWLGKPGLFAIASFIAYIIGVLSLTTSGAVVNWLSKKHRTSPQREDLGLGAVALGPKGMAALRGLVVDKTITLLSRSLGETYSQTHSQLLETYPDSGAVLAAISSNLPNRDRRAIVERHFDLHGATSTIAEDIEMMPIKLMGERPELYADWDRLSSEGEFRAAVAFPVGIIVAITAAYFPVAAAVPLAAIALLLTSALLWQARSRVLTANDRLAVALRAAKGQGSAAAESMNANALIIRDSELHGAEYGIIIGIAQRHMTEGRNYEAISYFSILAKTGDRNSNELLCDLTDQTRRYSDSSLLLDRLFEGMRHSGRLALRAILLVLEEPPHALSDDEDKARAVGAALFNATRDQRTRNFAWHLIHSHFKHLDGATRKRLVDDIKRVEVGDVETSLIFRKYPTLDLTKIRDDAPGILAALSEIERRERPTQILIS